MSKNDKAIQTENPVSEQSDEEGEAEVFAREEAVARRPHLTPDIFKLHALAFDELFDYLNFRDLESLGVTCYRMFLLTRLYIRQNYATAWHFPKRYDGDLISYRVYVSDFVGRCSYDVSFNEYSENLHIRSEETLDYIENNCRSVKCIRFDNFGTTRRIDSVRIKKSLSKIEFIIISQTGCELYERLLKFTPKLKMLRLNNNTSLEHEWLLHKYEMLERVMINFAPSAMMKTFLEQNPTVQSLTISVKCLIENVEMFKSTNISLDELGIDCFHSIDLKSSLDILKELHARGFYKRLHILTDCIDKENVAILPNLPSLQKLTMRPAGVYLVNIDESPTLPNLREFLYLISDDENLQSLVMNCRNLQRLLTFILTFDQLLFLTQNFVYLKEVVAGEFMIDKFFDVLALNEARKKLAGACKVIIYIDEKCYLQAKWKFGDQDFEMIEVKRIGTMPSIWNRQHFG